MKGIENQFFIAIVPPQELLNRIEAIKSDIALHYGTKAALRSPGHITLHMPFKLNVKKTQKLEEVLSNLKWDPLTIELHGYGCFEPKALYLNIVPNEALNTLQLHIAKKMKKALNVFNAQFKDRVFLPHITLAYRDLKKTQFYALWEAYENATFQAQFDAIEIALLKHNGTQWNVYKCFNGQ